jgi:hypothetical protein
MAREITAYGTRNYGVWHAKLRRMAREITAYGTRHGTRYFDSFSYIIRFTLRVEEGSV